MVARRARLPRAAARSATRLDRLSAGSRGCASGRCSSTASRRRSYQYLGMLLIVGASASRAEPQRRRRHEARRDRAAAAAQHVVRASSCRARTRLHRQHAVRREARGDARRRTTQHATHDGSIPLEAVHTLELDDVRYSYDGEVEALAGVSVAFHVGEIVGIVGPSGSGKSTLSQLILRLREPTGGADPRQPHAGRATTRSRRGTGTCRSCRRTRGCCTRRSPRTSRSSTRRSPATHVDRGREARPTSTT